MTTKYIAFGIIGGRERMFAYTDRKVNKTPESELLIIPYVLGVC